VSAPQVDPVILDAARAKNEDFVVPGPVLASQRDELPGSRGFREFVREVLEAVVDEAGKIMPDGNLDDLAFFFSQNCLHTLWSY
jgi:hypothetical protein